MQLDGRVILVTGGSRGIGRAIVKRIVECGGRACIADTDVAGGRDAVDEYGAHVRFERCDVSREANVRRAVAAAARWGNRLDGVVNNAALADPHIGPLERVSRARWQRALDINLTGALLVAKHAVRHLRRTHGAIVNIASTRALQSEPDTFAYAASKGGLVALTHALAISLGPDVRANCISPGWIATDELLPRPHRRRPKLRAIDARQHPVGRVGHPDDVASLCVWLLSDQAGFATGANIPLDGGMTRKMIYAP